MPKRRRHQGEYQIQSAVCQHLKLRAQSGVLWLHIPNQNRDARTGALLKRMGVLPGASDLLLWHNGNSFALELKSPGGRLSDAQLEFLARFNDAGVTARAPKVSTARSPAARFWKPGRPLLCDLCFGIAAERLGSLSRFEQRSLQLWLWRFLHLDDLPDNFQQWLLCNGRREAQSALRKPDGGAVFFSGEALYAGRDMGTVEAALASGRETAQTILAAPHTPAHLPATSRPAPSPAHVGGLAIDRTRLRPAGSVPRR